MGGFEVLQQFGNQFVQGFWIPYSYALTAWMLSWVFLSSGAAKIRDPSGTALAIVNFGIGRRPRSQLGLMLGLSELVLAIGLATPLSRIYVMFAASVTLWIFVALIARSLFSKETFACFCFGDSTKGLSRRTLIRAAVLATAATASLVLYQPASTQRLTEVLSATTALAILCLGALLGRVRFLATIERTELVTP